VGLCGSNPIAGAKQVSSDSNRFTNIMTANKRQAALAAATFAAARGVTTAYHRLGLPIISTGRSFAYYRKLLFDGRSEATVLRQLEGKRIVDVGCGLTPYVENSLFQSCYRAGIECYGIDPKLREGFSLGAFDRAKILATGGGKVNPSPPGMERAIGTMAHDLPFDDASVDMIVSCYLLFVWIEDESALKAIFREFERVLKPGGEIRVFPAPCISPAAGRHEGLAQSLQAFTIEQRFFSGLVPATGFAPAYRLILRKDGS
jgi:SAM-dependent methyltransferase